MMSRRVLIRLAPVATLRELGDSELARAEMFDAGRFTPLQRDGVPVVVNHDESRPIGKVLRFVTDDDVAGGRRGRWIFVWCDVAEPPAWLRKGSAASFEYRALWRQERDGWSHVLDALVSEVSILSPSVRPAEPLARVVGFGEPSSSSPAPARSERLVEREIVLPPETMLRRYFPSAVVRVR